MQDLLLEACGTRSTGNSGQTGLWCGQGHNLNWDGGCVDEGSGASGWSSLGAKLGG